MWMISIKIITFLCFLRAVYGQFGQFRPDMNECASSPCKNGATCRDLLNTYTCDCVVGWTGYNCQEDIDECALGTCKNGATCENSLGVFKCTCTPGWQGTNCDVDIDECVVNIQPCHNGATCTNLQNAYSCTCTSGWLGKKCNQGVQCFADSTITVQKPDYAVSVFAYNSKGKCVAGFSTYDRGVAVITGCEKNLYVYVTFSNFLFEGIDILGGEHIETHVINCKEIPEEGVVTNTQVLYNSSLAIHDKAEYPYVDVLSAIYTDSDENEVAVNVGIGEPVVLTIFTTMNNFLRPEACWAYGGLAVNESAPKKKLIEQGCTLDTSLCDDFVWQSPVNGTKLNMVLKGFRFYGFDFITILCSLRICRMDLPDYCVISCSNKIRRAENAKSEGQTYGLMSVARSIRVVDKYQEWDALSGVSTQDIDECALGTCKNGATCENSLGVFKCTCAPGWQGTNCDVDIDECVANIKPCHNGATCNNLQNAYSCTCTSGWLGKKCNQGVQCFADSTITVQKPDYAASVFAYNSKGKCVAGFSTYDRGVAVITGCEKNLYVYVTFSNFLFAGVDVLGGEHIETHVINCKEIPEEGVVTNTQVVYNSLLAIHDQAEYPYVDVRSAIYTDSDGDEVANNVGIGELVVFTIYTTMNNFLRPEACWAYGGLAVNESAPKKKLIELGCSLDTSLCDDFVWQSPVNGTKLNTVLKGFRFYGFDFITILCSLRICRIDLPDYCAISCSNKIRRAENAKSEGQTYGLMSVARSIRVVDKYQEWDALSGVSTQETRCLLICIAWLGLLLIE